MAGGMNNGAKARAAGRRSYGQQRCKATFYQIGPMDNGAILINNQISGQL